MGLIMSDLFELLRSVRQLSQENPVFSEASLRWLIFNSKQNGLDVALVRVGRRVLINKQRFNEWLQQRHSKGA